MSNPDAKPHNLRMPVELLDRLKVRASESGQSVTALLLRGAELVLAPVAPLPDVQAGIADLETEIAQLKRQLAARPVAAKPTASPAPVRPLTGKVADLAIPSFWDRHTVWADEAARKAGKAKE